MNSLSTFLRYEIWIFLTVLAAVVTYRLLVGTINTRGLIRDKITGRAISPGRLQLLVMTVGGALYYLSLVLSNTKVGEFPEVPKELLLTLGGSHAFYLAGKFSSMIMQVFGLSSPGNKSQT